MHSVKYWFDKHLYMYCLNPTTSRLSLLLHESEVKPRMSVNNNDNLQVQWDLSDFYPMLLMWLLCIGYPYFLRWFTTFCDQGRLEDLGGPGQIKNMRPLYNWYSLVTLVCEACYLVGFRGHTFRKFLKIRPSEIKSENDLGTTNILVTAQY